MLETGFPISMNLQRGSMIEQNGTRFHLSKVRLGLKRFWCDVNCANPNLRSQMQFNAADSGTQIGTKLQQKT